ncbi:ATP-grasp domain-containing protein [Hahella sp. HN01]|uniref:carboxylate--amine ligase n=1 Tax=Hahella sp. HN01 TaxID=2847262 RepID=UPI001C1F0A33|nr:ATP-grasp domain-containing protein [Hahella sp. HN01]MBU6950597.1 ATP-grasp domain-containing protein [Hahella sp. HN01]
MTNIRALILDANQRSALAATRSLGAQGIWVMTADESLETLAGASRFSLDKEVYASPYTKPANFFNDILKIISEKQINFLLPVTEASTYVILENREKLPKGLILPFSEAESIEHLANKNRLFQLAQSLGLPTPHTQYIESIEQAQSVLSDITEYPIVLKPFKSRILTDREIISTTVIIVHSRAEAEEALKKRYFRDYPFMIQSYIKGEGQGLFALYSQGSPVCHFSHRRLREKPPSGGVSVLCESKEVDSRMKQISDTLLHHANWNGVAMVEFKVADDGTPYLMEINPRFWGSLQLAIDSGVDFPYLLLTSFVNGAATPVDSFVVGQKMRWLLGDLDRLYLVLKSPSRQYSIGRKLLELLRFFLPNGRTKHEVNRLSDFKPFIFELKKYLRDLRS